MIKWLISWVFPGVPEVLAKPFLEQSILIKEDFPTLERPIKANSGLPSMGHLETSVLEMLNSTVLICMLQSYFKLLFLPDLNKI
jgi:hypothetical protein